MSYPPYRNQNEGSSYDRDAERRRREEEERDFRSRGEREGQRFRRDHSESFENEDRPFGGRWERGQFEDWEQPRRFGSDEGRQSYRRYETPRQDFRNEWQQQPRREERSGRFGWGEGGGYYGESGRFGEQRGQFAGRGPKNYRRSDQRIQEEVCDRLTSDPHVDASEIQVTVKDGEITLEGTVNERRMKRLAEDCAESVSGVSQVHNRLRVEDEGSRPMGKESQGSQSATRQSSSSRSSV
ncbi:MAG TPA: BON domain-containing protein [Myxococcota bacterium]|nr:BON domain-containing protein [Myxococcota bacterium]